MKLFSLLKCMKKIPNSRYKNQFKTSFCFADERMHSFSSSIYLPPQEAKFLLSLFAKKWRLRSFLKYAVKKYGGLLVQGYPKNLRIPKTIQSKVETKQRFSFRPDPGSWVEVQMLSLGLGVSCSMVVLELIRYEMKEGMEGSIKKSENVGMSIIPNPHTKYFLWKYNPKRKTIRKLYTFTKPKRFHTRS